MDQTTIPSPAPVTTPTPVTPPNIRWGLVLGVLGIALIAYAASAYFGSLWPFTPKIVACTEEAKICPDGTAVGRTGPNCEFAVCPSATPDSTSGWTDFSSKYFTLSFKVPAGVEVLDTQDAIDIAYGTPDSGMGYGNIFMGVYRYIGGVTKESAIASFKSTYANIAMSTVVMDGSSFIRLDGTDRGSGIKVFTVFLDKSSVRVSAPFDEIRNPKRDYVSIGTEILSTFKFVSTANWKTYTNAQYGFEFKYPSNWTYDGDYRIYFDKIDPATGKRQFSEGTGGFSLSIVDGNANAIYTEVRNNCQGYGAAFHVDDPIFSYRAITLAEKNGWEVNCSSEYGGPFTVTILPAATSKTIRIDSGYTNPLHAQILSTFKFTK